MQHFPSDVENRINKLSLNYIKLRIFCSCNIIILIGKLLFSSLYYVGRPQRKCTCIIVEHMTNLLTLLLMRDFSCNTTSFLVETI